LAVFHSSRDATARASSSSHADLQIGHLGFETDAHLAQVVQLFQRLVELSARTLHRRLRLLAFARQ